VACGDRSRLRLSVHTDPTLRTIVRRKLWRSGGFRVAAIIADGESFTVATHAFYEAPSAKALLRMLETMTPGSTVSLIRRS